jgi:hypothetical protein
MRRNLRSVEIFSEKTVELMLADLRFLEMIYLSGPEYPVRAPNSKILSMAVGRSPGYVSRRAVQADLCNGDGEFFRGGREVSAILK